MDPSKYIRSAVQGGKSTLGLTSAGQKLDRKSSFLLGRQLARTAGEGAHAEAVRGFGRSLNRHAALGTRGGGAGTLLQQAVARAAPSTRMGARVVTPGLRGAGFTTFGQDAGRQAGTAMEVAQSGAVARTGSTAVAIYDPNMHRGAIAGAPKVDSNKGFSATQMGDMGVMGMIGAGLGMGAIGGVTSYATGGEFGQGFAAGAVGGAAGRGLKRMALNNMAAGGGMNMTKKYAQADFGDGGKAIAGSVLNMGASGMQTMKARTAMMGGAALSGVMFGGDRSSHSRGFNQTRGNRF